MSDIPDIQVVPKPEWGWRVPSVADHYGPVLDRIPKPRGIMATKLRDLVASLAPAIDAVPFSWLVLPPVRVLGTSLIYGRSHYLRSSPPVGGAMCHVGEAGMVDEEVFSKLLELKQSFSLSISISLYIYIYMMIS